MSGEVDTSRERWGILSDPNMAEVYGKCRKFTEALLDERDALQAKLEAVEARALPEGCVAVKREKTDGLLAIAFDIEQTANLQPIRTRVDTAYLRYWASEIRAALHESETGGDDT